MQKKAYIKPTPDQTFEIIAAPSGQGNFRSLLSKATMLQEGGDIAEACNIRFQAIQLLQEILPEEEEVYLEWEHPNSRAAIELVNLSAIDHFLINDFEIASALLELSLEIDPEDHLEATNILAYCYLAMEEWELFDEVIYDISDKNANRPILMLWSTFLREGKLPEGEVRYFKTKFAPYMLEFTSSAHPIDESYKLDIERERPSQESLARELWLRTEHLWQAYPTFIEALQQAAH